MHLVANTHIVFRPGFKVLKKNIYISYYKLSGGHAFMVQRKLFFFFPVLSFSNGKQIARGLLLHSYKCINQIYSKFLLGPFVSSYV